ncbi:Gfo/Idh/MocA family oxidoreductase [Candidatus Bathyarchaeota archaeon]|nr:Gfo/Idh/MocA family oxidoreductase [Candidatus Bathyarchaeota archaeon]
MEKIRIGFVGCGGIAAEHMKGLIKNPAVLLVAFCDTDLSRARAAAEKFGASDAKIFDRAEDMFDRVEVDAAFFCIPPYAHGSEMVAIEHGIPFFVEKPIHLNLEQARRISSEVKKRGLITSVGYMNRYRKSIRMVREILREDPPILVLGGWIGGTPKMSPGVPIWNWWIRKELSGGQFHEQVTHTVDLARFLCGEVEEVHAYPARGFNRNVAPEYNIEDASVVNMKFVRGAVGSFWASCSSNGGGGGVTLSIYAGKTTALFSGWEHNLRLLRLNKEPLEVPGEPNIFEIEDYAFIEAVRLNDPTKVLCTYDDGLKTMEVTIAANMSMEAGKPIRLPI